jgi:pilus assembly protein CpaF
MNALPDELTHRVRLRLASAGTTVTTTAVAQALRAEGCVLGDAALLDAAAALHRDLAGAGRLEALLRDPDVTDVLVNAPDDVWVERAGQLLRTPEIRFGDEGETRRLAQRLAALAGRRLDDASPWVDARLPDGTRLHAMLPPLASRGTTICLRVPRRSGFGLADLIGAGLLSSSAAALLVDLLGARLAFLVTGGTGSGKTTLLQALLGLLPPTERVVLIEDSAELRPAHDHLIALEARPANQDGAGAVGMRDLVRQALRMRPDRLVVGEARGTEIVDLLGALNTGHQGGCATLHANRAEDVPARVEALALPAGLGRQAVHSQLAAGLDCVLHLARDSNGGRRLHSVSVLDRTRDGLCALVPAAWLLPSGELRGGPGYQRLRDLMTGGRAGVEVDR